MPVGRRARRRGCGARAGSAVHQPQGGPEMITRDITGRLVFAVGQVTDIPLAVQLAYDEENDPLAVVMIINAGAEDVVWTFSLDLLNEGLHSALPVDRKSTV